MLTFLSVNCSLDLMSETFHIIEKQEGTKKRKEKKKATLMDSSESSFLDCKSLFLCFLFGWAVLGDTQMKYRMQMNQRLTRHRIILK